jgi:hypothetical protein
MIPKILTKLNQHRPNAEWIKTKSGLPYLPLDIKVPVLDIQNEWEKVKHIAVRHRDSDAFLQYKNEEWFSLTLYGIDSTYTEHSEKKHEWTEIANQCPKTSDFFKTVFKEKNFEGRIRFMLLGPRGYILPHKDRTSSGLSEVNIAINNPEGCKFVIENKGIVPFKKGSVVMLDLSNKHWVVNDSDEPRLHMIYHGRVPENIIKNSYENLYYTNK